ncbi:phosphorylated adapter RNA export protein-like isoform X1 [Homalodisca vitripennis]|uniref:phosphorylated adapter RNA export protein-like isoform X1 n=1 Tax=Homalodisca vitripennis TaxID=197043 RepID=UPI001EEC2156|nr:phosphorylated adapter RNA export protein-like isoform X1 [Homalodisca vitripennis]
MEEDTDVLEDGEIVEECDTSSAPVSFSLSRAISREPETICSEESSNDNSDDSDDDSDAQCSKPKKVKPQCQLPVSRKEVPNKYKVWSVAIQEEALTETLTKCDVEAIDRERSVESYNYKVVDNTDYSHYNDFHMSVSECPLIENKYINSKYGSNDRRFGVGSKRRHSDIKQRIGHGDNCRAYKMANLSVTADDPPEDVAEDIAKKLRESKIDLILNVVLVLGKEKAIALYNETKDVEDNGGMLLMNGERRRTAGGVYFLLLKRDNTISSDATKEIFNDKFCNRKKKKAHRKKKSKKYDEIKETLIREKLLGLNTAAYPPESDTKQSGGLLDAESNNLEEGEVELTVTNPPPSPATDQDTPPSRTLVYSEDETEHVDTGTSICAESIGRKVVSYEDDDDGDFLDLDVDEMDVF